MKSTATNIAKLTAVVVIALALALIIAQTMPTTRPTMAARGVACGFETVGLAVRTIEVLLTDIAFWANKISAALACAVGIAAAVRCIAICASRTEDATIISVKVRCTLASAIYITLPSARARRDGVTLDTAGFSEVAFIAVTRCICPASTVIVAHSGTMAVQVT
jgi:hypothetical protein